MTKQVARGRIEHQPAGSPSHQATRPDQRNDCDGAADQRWAAQHAPHDCDTAIEATQLVLDFLGRFRQLLPLSRGAHQQIAMVNAQLIEALAHGRARS
jgi:hypothetical protein